MFTNHSLSHKYQTSLKKLSIVKRSSLFFLGVSAKDKRVLTSLTAGQRGLVGRAAVRRVGHAVHDAVAEKGYHMYPDTRRNDPWCNKNATLGTM